MRLQHRHDHPFTMPLHILNVGQPPPQRVLPNIIRFPFHIYHSIFLSISCTIFIRKKGGISATLSCLSFYLSLQSVQVVHDDVALFCTFAISKDLRNSITYIADKAVNCIKHTLLILTTSGIAVLALSALVLVHIGVITGQTGIIRAVHILPGTLVASSAVGYCTTKRITII